jgi:homocitrate synthase
MVSATCSCHSQDPSSSVDRNDDMVGVENSRVGRPTQATNGFNGANGANGTEKRPAQRNNPYAPRASDFLNNVANFKIIESTLRGKSTIPLDPLTHL